MASNDPSIRRILPQDSQNAQSVGMNSYTFAPQQYPQRETQKSENRQLRFPPLVDWQRS